MKANPPGVQIFPSDTQFMGPLDKDIPTRRSTERIKLRSRLRAMWSFFVRGLYAPIFNANAFFGLITIPFSIFFLSAFLGEKGVISRLDTLGATVLSTVAALPIWALVNVVWAYAKTISAERAAGTWQGPRFIFREPQLILTYEWRVTDNQGFVPIQLAIDDGLLIDYRIDIDGAESRTNCLVMGAYFFRPIEAVLRIARFDRRGRAVVKKDRTVGLHCYLLPDTLPTQLRVYMLAFENNHQTLMDYTETRTETRIVVEAPKSSDQSMGTASSQIAS